MGTKKMVLTGRVLLGCLTIFQLMVRPPEAFAHPHPESESAPVACAVPASQSKPQAQVTKKAKKANQGQAVSKVKQTPKAIKATKVAKAAKAAKPSKVAKVQNARKAPNARAAMVSSKAQRPRQTDPSDLTAGLRDNDDFAQYSEYTPATRSGRTLRGSRNKDGIRPAFAELDPVEQQLESGTLAPADVTGAQPAPMTEKANWSAAEVPSTTWLTDEQTLANPVPRGGMLIADAQLTAATAAVETTQSTNLGNLDSKSDGVFGGPKLALKYGINDNFFISAKGSYLPGRTTQESGMAGPFFLNNFNQKTSATVVDEGWREPQLGVGATGRLSSAARITGEVVTTIPVGAAKSTVRGTETTTNGLEGGGAIEPRLTLVTKVAAVKLIGMVGYSFAFDRRTERTVEVGATSSTLASTVTGGNATRLGAGMEFPSAYNLGTLVTWERRESTISTPTDSFLAQTQQTAQSGSQWLGGSVYMGFPIVDTKMTLVPSVGYATRLDRSLADTTTPRADNWSLGLGGVMHF